ncbi:hypothetical protein C8F04DRAFT_1253112 [Mycena alexandri]|uniref:Uncharacterized protein n=1 Tax=Mycena alexandri TaxID=1745969 RepID=A0AAD6T7U1_9AGAR|nr:hypothetical protein C8F04DRAFT_1253112 [Mycena alexandri]
MFNPPRRSLPLKLRSVRFFPLPACPTSAFRPQTSAGYCGLQLHQLAVRARNVCIPLGRRGPHTLRPNAHRSPLDGSARLSKSRTAHRYRRQNNTCACTPWSLDLGIAAYLYFYEAKTFSCGDG